MEHFEIAVKEKKKSDEKKGRVKKVNLLATENAIHLYILFLILSLHNEL